MLTVRVIKLRIVIKIAVTVDPTYAQIVRHLFQSLVVLRDIFIIGIILDCVGIDRNDGIDKYNCAGDFLPVCLDHLGISLNKLCGIVPIAVDIVHSIGKEYSRRVGRGDSIDVIHCIRTHRSFFSKYIRRGQESVKDEILGSRISENGSSVELGPDRDLAAVDPGKNLIDLG